MSGDNRHLDIFFPEWQGYGESESPFQGTHALKKLCPNIEFCEIPVGAFAPLSSTRNILGYDDQVNNLREVRSILLSEAPKTTFMLGGTCASELGPVSYLNDLYRGDLAIFWLDAHGDLNTPQSSPSGHFHGMPLRTLIGEGDEGIDDLLFSTVDKTQIFLAGGRDYDPPELTFINNNQLNHFTPEELSHPMSVIESIAARFNRVYIHLDLDVLDPGDFPHVLMPVSHGISRNVLFEMIDHLHQHFSIVGASLLEYVPHGRGAPVTMRELVSLLRKPFII